MGLLLSLTFNLVQYFYARLGLKPLSGASASVPLEYTSVPVANIRLGWSIKHPSLLYFSNSYRPKRFYNTVLGYINVFTVVMYAEVIKKILYNLEGTTEKAYKFNTLFS